MKRLLALSLILISGCKPATSPSADLASPSQEVRDAAAKVLRATAKPPSKLKWFFFTHRFHKGESKTNVLALLRSYNLNIQPEAGMGGIGEYVEYRLDDYWLIGCEFNNNDYQNLYLEQWKLVARWRDFWMPPSTNFSGVWITYYVNGQKSSEAHYVNGHLSGESISYYPTGTNSSIRHYDQNHSQGAYAQFIPSGQIQYQGQYSNSTPVGIWIRYNENGSTNYLRDYAKPRTNQIIIPN